MTRDRPGKDPLRLRNEKDEKTVANKCHSDKRTGQAGEKKSTQGGGAVGSLKEGKDKGCTPHKTYDDKMSKNKKKKQNHRRSC